MKIILVEEINKLGVAGDLVKVADGYARNYLLPKKMAILATRENIKKIEAIKKVAEDAKMEKLNALKALAERINGVELKFVRKADENGGLYGSVSEFDIASSLKDLGHDVHKSSIQMEKHLKELGTFDVDILLATSVTSTVKVIVEAE